MAEEAWKKEIDKVYNKHISSIQKDVREDLIFHYTSPVGLLGILNSESLWLTDCDFLNDSSESKYFSEIYDVSKIKAKNKIEENFLFKAFLIVNFHTEPFKRRRTLSGEGEKHYLLSFSLNDDNLSLWTYYTKTSSSVGYNIGFKLNELLKFKLLDNQMLVFGRVIYNRDYQIELVSELLEDYKELYIKLKYTHQRNYLFEKLESNITIYSLFMKNEAFKNENEFRVAIIETGKTKDKLLFREMNGAFIPYLEKVFDLKSLDSIMISPTTKSDLIKASTTNLLDCKNLSDVKIKSSEIPLRY